MANKIHCFTSICPEKVNVLINEVSLTAAYSPPTPSKNIVHKKFFAIWDTGATNTVISERVVKDCGLKPVGMAKVRQADGTTKDVNDYLVNIRLPNAAEVYNIRVTEGRLRDQANVLIGMDIINKGDFAVTNYNGKTVFSFRIPSTERIDFIEQLPESKSPVKVPPKVGRNDPCPCNSGKKYKNCCLKKNR
jgi:hypothetical protein